MTRDELIARTRALVEDGERLDATPSLDDLRSWLAASDVLLAEAWGTMDRYHLVWLSVGRPPDAIRDRAMTAKEEAAYVREVAAQKTAALRMSLDAVERHGMPFLGEGRPARGAAADAAPSDGGPAETGPDGTGRRPDGGGPTPGSGEPTPGAGGTAPGLGLAETIRQSGPDLAERIREARERTLSDDPAVVRRAPNPERMRR